MLTIFPLISVFNIIQLFIFYKQFINMQKKLIYVEFF